jgi:hypothetical protein
MSFVSYKLFRRLFCFISVSIGVAPELGIDLSINQLKGLCDLLLSLAFSFCLCIHWVHRRCSQWV